MFGQKGGVVTVVNNVGFFLGFHDLKALPCVSEWVSEWVITSECTQNCVVVKLLSFWTTCPARSESEAFFFYYFYFWIFQSI